MKSQPGNHPLEKIMLSNPPRFDCLEIFVCLGTYCKATLSVVE